MAITNYVLENKLHKQARATTTTSKVIGVILSMLAVAAYVRLEGNIWPSVVLVVLAIYFFNRSGSNHIISSGAVGEDYAMAILSHLPDNFTLLNQLDIPNDKSKTGVNEADVVVCGPNAIFVIEVKNNNGTISCDEDSQRWHVAKVGRAGGEYEKDMRNPIKQTKNLVWLVNEYLKRANSKVWVQGIVLFTNPEASLEIYGKTTLPILIPSELLDFITSFQANDRGNLIGQATEQLIKLR
jgi:hypothetical protein